MRASHPGLPTHIVVATTVAELNAIYRLGYEVYVAEFDRLARHADHEQRQLRDRHDGSALHLCVERDGAIQASVRLHIGAIPAALAASLSFDRLPGLRIHQCALISKLMVRRDVRCSRVVVDLMRAVYGVLSKAAIDTAFCTTFPHLVSLYERLGFRCYADPYIDVDLGPHIALIGSVGDAWRSERLRWLTGIASSAGQTHASRKHAPCEAR